MFWGKTWSFVILDPSTATAIWHILNFDCRIKIFARRIFHYSGQAAYFYLDDSVRLDARSRSITELANGLAQERATLKERTADIEKILDLNIGVA